MDYSDKQKYWQYQYQLGIEYLIPQLQQWGAEIGRTSVLDIGCAEAGVLCAMVARGAAATGMELSPSRLHWARQIAIEKNFTLQLLAADFFHPPIRPDKAFDVIILRDVFEHLPDKMLALKRLAEMMSPSTRLLLTFPPFYSPFGGHQQVLKSFWRRVPYFHVLPSFLWRLVRSHIERVDRNAGFLAEMEKLRRHRATISQLKRESARRGLRIVAARYYHSRPSYKLRYGWPVLESRLIGRIPILREWLITGVTMVLAKNA